MRKSLLWLTSIVELTAGLALVLAPILATSWLLGTSLDSEAALVMIRMTGLALFTLSIACFLVRRDAEGQAATGLIGAMTFYNFSVAGLFVYSGLVLGIAGIFLWPVVGLHGLLGIWCLVGLKNG